MAETVGIEPTDGGITVIYCLAGSHLTTRPRLHLGARDRPRTGTRMGLSHPGMPIPFTRAKTMVGALGVEPRASPKEIRFYRPVQPTTICLTPIWCEGRESNPYPFRDRFLRPARLPVTPPSQTWYSGPDLNRYAFAPPSEDGVSANFTTRAHLNLGRLRETRTLTRFREQASHACVSANSTRRRISYISKSFGVGDEN